jgi:hypothetical protein
MGILDALLGKSTEQDQQGEAVQDLPAGFVPTMDQITRASIKCGMTQADINARLFKVLQDDAAAQAASAGQ